MAKFSRALFLLSVFAIALVWNFLMSAQTQPAPTPQQALINLYNTAQQLIKDPGGDYENGTYPYPSLMQKQWDDAMSAHGNDLSQNERNLYTACVVHLNAAITDVEVGYNIQASQPKSNTAAQADGQKHRDLAPPEVAQCAAALKLAQGEVGSSTSNTTLQGQTSKGSADGSAVDGSPEEAALPGSIDWTPPLDPLFTYLSNEWQRTINDPKNKDWAPDNAGNTLTLKLQPNEVPEVVSATGSRSTVFNNIMQDGRLPRTTFPAGSGLRFVQVSPTFFVKGVPGKFRTRLKYYERGGIFKSYRVAQ
jgi:hypothetical protein